MKQKFVTLIRLIQMNEGAHLRLLSPSSLDKIKELFNFGPGVEVQQREGSAPLIRFALGEYKLSDSAKVAILRLQIELRKLVLEIEGSSEEAETLYETLVSLLVELSGVEEEILRNPLLEIDESVIVSHMSFPPEALFVPEVFDAITSTVVDKGGFEFATALAIPTTIAFDIEYLPTDRTMIERRIGLTRKELSIRPKAGYELSEQVYESKAPLPTGIHLELLEMIEGRLSRP